MAQTLKDVMPLEFSGGEYRDQRAQRFADVEVVKRYDGTERGQGWPGTHKHVYHWFALANGYSVGWNESPSRGWAFPVVKWSAPDQDQSKVLEGQ